MKQSRFRLLTIGLLMLQTFLLFVLLSQDHYRPDVSIQDEATLVETRLPDGDRLAQGDPDSVEAVVTIAQLQATVREVLQHELVLAFEEIGATHKQANQPPMVTVDSAKQEEAALMANQIVSRAISARTWTESDTRELVPHLSNMSEDQYLEVLDQFHGAVNRQELDLQDFPPL